MKRYGWHFSARIVGRFGFILPTRDTPLAKDFKVEEFAFMELGCLPFFPIYLLRFVAVLQDVP